MGVVPEQNGINYVEGDCRRGPKSMSPSACGGIRL
jgi:hypothetical protein